MKSTIQYRLKIFLLLLCLIISDSSVVLAQETYTIPPSDKNFLYTGRIDFSNQFPKFSYTGSSVRFRFEGRKCIVKISNNGTSANNNYYAIIVDDSVRNYQVTNSTTKLIIENLKDGIHEVAIFKKTESLVGEGVFYGIELEEGKKILPSQIKYARKIEFIGNSITCGYGNEGPDQHCKFSAETENGYMSYASITARKLNAECMMVAYSGRGMYRNNDGATTNTIPLIYDRIFPDKADSPKWDTKKWQPDLVVINLGTNDFAKGIPDSAAFVSAYVNFLKQLRSYYPKASLLCITGPMMNDSWPPEIKTLSTLKKYIDIIMKERDKTGDKNIYSFSLTPQGEGDLGCDWHPNIKKHIKMSEELSEKIKTIMSW
jgi:lysophospholipase L1-like esterase